MHDRSGTYNIRKKNGTYMNGETRAEPCVDQRYTEKRTEVTPTLTSNVSTHMTCFQSTKCQNEMRFT